MKRRPIMIMAGGTGGHVFPALTIAKELIKNSQEVIWLGTKSGLESTLVPKNGIPIEWINVKGLRGKGIFPIIFAPITLLYALFQSLILIIKHKPTVVLGMGGFVSGPGGIAAWLARKPLVIHEQNAIAGFTNKFLARFAEVVLQAFSESFNSKIQAEKVGNPIRSEILSMNSPSDRFKDRIGSMRLLILGGSQGSTTLNRVIPKAISLLPKDLIPEVRHQTGINTFSLAEKIYKDHAIDVRLFSFIEDMADAYKWADLVICRSGALTVAELSAAGLPAIFIPFPNAVDDHQKVNAQVMVRAGAARIIDERDLTASSLAVILKDWLGDRKVLLERAEKSHSLALPSSVEKITNHIQRLAGISHEK